MTIIEKVAYLKGLADGLDLKEKPSKEAKILLAVIDVLDDICFSIEDLEEASTLLTEGLDVVSEDLEDVEAILFGEDDEDDDDCCCGGDCKCGHDDEENEIYFQMPCPNCEEDLDIDDLVLECGEVVCTNCGDIFALDLVDDVDDEDEEEEGDEA